jgi:hypothetical protein
MVVVTKTMLFNINDEFYFFHVLLFKIGFHFGTYYKPIMERDFYAQERKGIERPISCQTAKFEMKTSGEGSVRLEGLFNEVGC